MRDPWDAKFCAELKKKGSGIVTDPRFRIESVTCFGIIPGPKKPKDLHSFLPSIVDEFKLLALGVLVVNSSTLVEN